MAPSCLLYLCAILMVRGIHILDIKTVYSGIVGRSFSRTFVTIVAQLFYVDAGALLFFYPSTFSQTAFFNSRWSFIIVWNVCSEWSPLMSPCQVLQQPSPQVRLTKLLTYCQQTQCLDLNHRKNCESCQSQVTWKICPVLSCPVLVSCRNVA